MRRTAQLIVKIFTVGILEANCYIVGCERTGEAVIIDPGFWEAEYRLIMREADRSNLHVRYIVNTHGHFDHISGNGIMKRELDIPILIHEEDENLLRDPERNLSRFMGLNVTSPPADRLLHDGEDIEVGDLTLRVLHTPGHTRGSISIVGEDAVFTGDTLFKGSIGRTDLPGSSFKEIIHSIRDKIMRLPDGFVIYPGHGPASTIRREMESNPFITSLSREPS